MVVTDRDRLINNEQVKMTVAFLSRIGFILICLGVVPVFFEGATRGALLWAVTCFLVGGAFNVAAFKYIGKLI